MPWFVPLTALLLTASSFVSQVAGSTQCSQGVASWYNKPGHLTASGQPFNPNAYACASRFYPFGTRLKVETQNGFSVVVIVNDRGPHRRFSNRILDLTPLAFSHLAGLELGLVPVKVTPL